MTFQRPDELGKTTGEPWAIIGGGMLGMTLALRLAQRGIPVTLFESAPGLGGLADAWELGNVTWDRHYHVTLLSDSYLRNLLAELGLADSMRWVETKTGFYTGGQLYSVSNSWEFLTFPPLRLIDKLRLGWTLFYGSKVRNWRRLEQIPVADWLLRLSGRRTFDKLWLPLLRAKLGENYRQTSAAFIWATIGRLYAARRSGLKKEMFGYLPGGYARTIASWQVLLEQLGVTLRLGTQVHEIRESTAGGVSVQTSTEKQVYGRVVLTVPGPIVARLLTTLSSTEKSQHAAIPYQGIVCASVLLRRPLSSFYVTNITDDQLPFTGVIEMTTLVDPSELDGHSLVYLPKYVPSDDAAFEWSDDEVRRRFLAGLCAMHPDLDIERDVVTFRVSRVRHVMALPTLGYSMKLPPRETSVPGVAVVNSAQIVNGTLNVNETIKLAEQAVDELCQHSPHHRPVTGMPFRQPGQPTSPVVTLGSKL